MRKSSVAHKIFWRNSRNSGPLQLFGLALLFFADSSIRPNPRLVPAHFRLVDQDFLQNFLPINCWSAISRDTRRRSRNMPTCKGRTTTGAGNSWRRTASYVRPKCRRSNCRLDRVGEEFRDFLLDLSSENSTHDLKLCII